MSTFKGIAYAGPVSGVGRFKPVSWSGVRDAARLGPPSIRPPNATSGFFEPACEEDCLALNVWTPTRDGKPRPVMFYNHGGGYTTGSGGARGQDGANLAVHNDVVVVETNHRLGLMGYPYLGEILGPEYQANQGMLDILAGLKWVKANIAAFGGDPDNVMIWGESGGAGKTSFLYGMPMADAYFNKALIESGGPRAFRDFRWRQDRAAPPGSEQYEPHVGELCTRGPSRRPGPARLARLRHGSA